MRSALLHEVDGLRTFAVVMDKGDEVAAALSAFAHDHDLTRQQNGGLTRGGEHLGPQESPGSLGCGRARREDRGGHGEAQAGDVGEHVPGVGEQSQAARDESAHDLHREDRRGDGEHHDQPTPAPGARGEAVTVAVIGHRVRARPFPVVGAFSEGADESPGPGFIRLRGGRRVR